VPPIAVHNCGALRRCHFRVDRNSRAELTRRRDAGVLTWRGPALVLFARSACAVIAQALTAAIFAFGSSPTPWRDTEAWLPVYGTLIDAGCLALLWRLMRREGIGLFTLVGFDRTRLFRDVLIGLVLIAPSLVLILGGVAVSGLLVYGTPRSPYLFGALPLPAAFYGVLIFPIIWGLTEQMTYNAYLLPRIEVLGRSTGWAVALVAFAWSIQHAFMPMTFDAKFMIFRALSPIPFSVFITIVYLRIRRLLPFVLAHAAMDGASVFVGVLLPLLRS
jgi:hypothetical protein